MDGYKDGISVEWYMQSYDMKYSAGAANASVPLQNTGEAMKSNLGFGRTDGLDKSGWRKFALPEL